MDLGVKYWFYGHTHTPCEKQINSTLCLCNPIGYPEENDEDVINFNKIIEIK